MKFYKKIEEICKAHKKVALFVDMDGTIAEYKVYQEGTITNETKGLFLNAEPVKVIIDNLEKINKIDNLDIYILSLSRSNLIKKEKEIWLEKYAPFIEKDKHIIPVRENNDYNSETRNYIKAQKMQEKLDEYDYVILLDDEHKILRITQKELKDKGEVYHITTALI